MLSESSSTFELILYLSLLCFFFKFQQCLTCVEAFQSPRVRILLARAYLSSDLYRKDAGHVTTTEGKTATGSFKLLSEFKMIWG